MSLEDLWTLDDAGLEVPDALALHDQQKLALQDPESLGPTFLFHPDDPIVQYMEIVSEQLASCYQLLLLVYLWQDPDQAQGAALRERGSIVGANIRSRTRSTIDGRITGTPGTVVPAGKLLKYVANDSIWQTSEEVTIEAAGSVATSIESFEYGPIEADIAGVAGWLALDVVPGWAGFASTAELQTGADPPDNEEIREAIRVAATGGGGHATYNSDVQNIGEVDGVLYVALYVNRTGVYDAIQDLPMKSAHFVIEGGRKQDLFDAIGDTASTALDCETTGFVQGTTTRSNGQVLLVSYSRVENRPVLLRLTITGGNVQVPLPSVEATTAIAISAAMDRNDEQNVGQKFIPKQYEAAVLQAFEKNAVSALVAEARLSTGDPWITTPISMALVERAILRPDAVAAEIVGLAEDPVFVLVGWNMEIEVDGVPSGVFFFPDSYTAVTDVADVINSNVVGVTAGDNGGRLVIRSNTTGSGSSLKIVNTSNSLITALGLVEDLLYEGTDGDITVIVIP